jgi:hypothetical protein
LLLYDFSFLPAQVFALAFSALKRCFRIAGAAVSADFHVEPMFLRDGFLHWV